MVRRVIHLFCILAMSASAAGAGGDAADAGGLEPILALLDPARPIDKAILDAHAAVESSPDSAAAHLALGNALREGALIGAALTEYQHAAEIEPDNSVAWNNAGVAQSILGDADAAREAFATAVERNPRNSEARYNLAHLLYAKGEFDEAVEELRTALLSNPELGDRAINPRAFHSKLMLAARLALYRQVVGANTLSTMGAVGEPSFGRSIEAPWLIAASVMEEEEEPGAIPDSSSRHPSAAKSAAPPARPTPVPTPIELRPESPSGASAVEPPTTRKVGGRTIKRGGPRRGRR